MLMSTERFLNRVDLTFDGLVNYESNPLPTTASVGTLSTHQDILWSVLWRERPEISIIGTLALKFHWRVTSWARYPNTVENPHLSFLRFGLVRWRNRRQFIKFLYTLDAMPGAIVPTRCIVGMENLDICL
jgi:hypothetical protein